jgi:hypothetical protein
MGFFSWKTMDTNKSIPNIYSNKKTFPVYMIDDKGNIWEEKEYDGYGVFGGKDYYELLAEMNGLSPDRELGIELKFNKEGKKFISPNLVENKNWDWKDEHQQSCEYQGFFY